MDQVTFNNRKLIGERLYYLTFVYAVVITFLLSTNFIPILSGHALHWLLYFSLILTFIKMYFIDSVDKKKLMFQTIVYMIAVVSWRLSRNVDIMIFISFILAAKDINFRTVIKLYFGTMLIMLLGTVIISQANIIKDGIYIRDGFRRHSLGIIYPTDMAAYVFYLILAYFYLSFHKITWRSAIVVLVIDSVLYGITQARNSVLMIAIAVIVVMIAQRASYEDHRISRGIASFYWMVGPLSAYATLLLSWQFRSNNKFFNVLNRAFSNRLWLSHKAINKFGLSLFGQHVVEHAFGGVKGLKQFYHPKFAYFYIDSSYIRLAVIYGVAVGVLLIIFMGIIAYRSTMKREYALTAIIMLIALHSVVEQHLFDISFDPFFIALFATVPKYPYNKVPLTKVGGRNDSK